MKKLLKKLAAWLNIPSQGKIKSFRIFGILVKPAAIISSKNKWNLANLKYFDPLFDKLYFNGNIVIVNRKT